MEDRTDGPRFIGATTKEDAMPSASTSMSTVGTEGIER